jgi:hypothetical protein
MVFNTAYKCMSDKISKNMFTFTLIDRIAFPSID